MKYIDELMQNCATANAAKSTNRFTLKELDDLDKVQNAIYIIEEVGGDMSDTRSAFELYKKSADRKCPKINKSPSTVLYIGSSTTGIKKRIKEHLGDGHKSTYGLNLKHWFSPRAATISILEYDVSPEVLQIIEDAISHDLVPAFGKSGGNGR